MPFQVPQSVPYRSPLNTVPAFSFRDAPEGNRMIHAEILWATMGGSNFSVQINAAQNSPQNFTQILALNVDNSRCGADVVFSFPDTGSELTVPAYEEGVFPVFTGQTTFYVYCLNQAANTDDVTTFDILNFLPPPISVPRAALQQVATGNGAMGWYGTGSVNAPAISASLVPAALSGSVNGWNLYVNAGANAGGTFTQNWALQDGAAAGTGVTLWSGSITIPANTFFPFVVANLSNLNLRFYQGLNLIQWGTNLANLNAASGGGYNLFYRTP